MKILLYVLTIGVVYIHATSIPQALLGRLFSKFNGYPGLLLGSFSGAIATWFLIDFIWRISTGQHIPFLMLGLAMSWLFLHYMVSYKQLNEGARHLMPAEFFAILVVALYLLFQSEASVWL